MTSDEDGYWQSAEAHTFTEDEWEDLVAFAMTETPPDKRNGQGLFQHLSAPWRRPRPSLVCTCVWHFAPGMDMVRVANPDCPWIEHRRLAQQREEGP